MFHLWQDESDFGVFDLQNITLYSRSITCSTNFYAHLVETIARKRAPWFWVTFISFRVESISNFWEYLDFSLFVSKKVELKPIMVNLELSKNRVKTWKQFEVRSWLCGLISSHVNSKLFNHERNRDRQDRYPIGDFPVEILWRRVFEFRITFFYLLLDYWVFACPQVPLFREDGPSGFSQL